MAADTLSWPGKWDLLNQAEAIQYYGYEQSVLL